MHPYRHRVCRRRLLYPVLAILAIHPPLLAEPQTPPTSSAESPAPPEPVEGEGDRSAEAISPPELIRYVDAELPRGSAIDAPTAVNLELSIGTDGKVTSARAIDSNVPPELARAAENAAAQFLFSPAMVGSEPVPVIVEYTYWFAPQTVAEPSPEEPVRDAGAAPPPRSGPKTAPDTEPEPTDSAEPLEIYEATAEVEAPPREPTERVLPKERLGKMPGSRGDALRAVEVLPGVSRAPLGTNPIIRGSAGHESLTFLNGVQIPELYHFGGVTSVVHPALLEEVRLYPGNFSARYGRATGGIIEAKLRSPKTDAPHAMLDFNLIDSSVLAEAPLGDGLSVAAAARRSNIDLVFENFVPEGTFGVVAAPLYWDYQAIADYRLDSRERFRVWATGSRDELKFIFDEPNQEDLSLRGELSGSLEYHTLTLAYDKRSAALVQDYQLSIGKDALKQKVGVFEAYFDSIRIAARSEWDVRASESFHWISGIDFSGLLLTGAYRGPVAPAQEGSSGEPDAVSGLLVVEEQTLAQLSPAVYTEARWFATPRWLLVPGLRLDFFEDLDALTINPRLSQRYSLTDEWTLKAGVGAYSQRPLYYESFAPVGNPNIGPYHALHTSLGAERRFGEALTLDGEAFYKYLYDRVVATEGGVPPQFVNDGQGRAYGFEASARVTPNPSVFGQLSYTLSRSERQDRDDPWRLFDYDQTHVLNAAFSTALGAGWQVGARFRWVTGNPVTPVVGAVFDARSGLYHPRYGAQNSDRDPAFHQLDLRVDKRFDIGSGALSAYLELLNAYNAENPEGFSYSYDYSERERVVGQPFFPNIGIRGEL